MRQREQERESKGENKRGQGREQGREGVGFSSNIRGKNGFECVGDFNALSSWEFVDHNFTHNFTSEHIKVNKLAACFILLPM